MVPPAAATESRSARSQATGTQEGPALAHATSASRSDLARPMTCAPLALSALIVSKPIPELQPVTTMRLPVRSMPASTLSAVERAPNGVDLTIRNTSLPGLIQRRAEHARRDRHPLDEFFSRYRTLLEAARRGMQRARQIRRRQPGRSAKTVQRRIRDGPGNREFELSLVAGERRSGERDACAHEVRRVRSERPDKPSRPCIAGVNQPPLQAVFSAVESSESSAQMPFERLLPRVSATRVFFW